MKKPFEILLDNAVSLLIAASGITGALSFLIADAASAWQERPAAMCLTASAFALVGILVACCLGVRDAVRDAKKAEFERRVAEEREAMSRKAEEEKREELLCRQVRHMDFYAKCFLCKVYERGPQLYDESWESDMGLYATTLAVQRCQILAGETAEGSMVYDLTTEGRAFLDGHPELLARASEVLRQDH